MTTSPYKRKKNERTVRPPSDESLLHAIAKGDFLAYGQLIRKHRVGAQQRSFLLTKDQNAAGKLTVIALMTIWNERENLSGIGLFEDYLDQLILQLYQRGFPH